MSKYSVSIVIPVWNQWQFTRACLDTLKPTVGVRDEIIVVDNGSEDQTPSQLRTIPGIKVITNETNLGFAKACNQGAAAATGDIVVFLNNDTLVPGHWLDELIAPFADESVAATGPRSNFVAGGQMVPNAGYDQGSIGDFRRWARTWMKEHRGETTEVHKLIGFCLAVRRSAFEAIGGFDEGFGLGGAEDDDLSLRLTQAGGRLLICHGSFVHHHGHATFDGNNVDWYELQQKNLDRFRVKHGGAPAARREPSGPLLSACMIVKDEEDLLPTCLAALSGVVDEVVIYDTGSSDKSIAIARAAGAKVIEGFWDDDFGRARNAALAECSAEWVMHVDADEVFEGDPRDFRQQLLDARNTALQLEILNLSGDGRGDMTHRPCRVFKRALYKWSGRLHEQVVLRSGEPRTELGVIGGARLVHSGYTPEQMTKKNKAERNLRLAQAEHAEGHEGDPVDKLTNLARSYTFANNHEEALSLYTQARSMQTPFPSVRRTLLRAGAQACLALGRPQETLEWAQELAAASSIQDSARWLKGMAHLELSNWQQALDEFDGLDEMKDDDGVVFPKGALIMGRARCHGELGNWEATADEVTLLADDENSSEEAWTLGIEAYWRAGRNMSTFLSKVPQQKLNDVFGQLVAVPAEAADAALEYLYADLSARANVLALAIRVAPKLEVERCLEWSARLREIGREQDCPLIARGWDSSVSPADRIRAATVASAAFDDQRGLPIIRQAAMAVPEGEFPVVLTQISELKAEYLEPFIVAASDSPERAFAMGRCLHKLGADEEGVAVVMHGFENNTASTLATDAANWLESVGHPTEAAALRNG